MERRIRVVGLCLIAVFALSAVIAVASAQASVEVGQCAKLLKTGKGETSYKGRYNSKTCGNKAGEEATPEEQGLGGPKNKYEWKPGPAGNGAFTGKGKTVAITAGELEVTCKTSVSSGAIRGAGTIEARFNFKGCVQPKNENKKCTTHGKELGEIETHALIGIFEEGAEPGKEPLIQFTHKGKGTISEPAEPWVEFECIEKKFTVSGILTGKNTQVPNEMTKKGGVEFSALVGKQELVASFPSPFSEEPETAPVTLYFAQSAKFEGKYELRQL
ncbi:MAG TPA: hypothetical protein VMB91_03825 [Solirubrobacteraceae bacterium]|nr:hypothetical protein [Solirubrobacteraceae bacterium]